MLHTELNTHNCVLYAICTNSIAKTLCSRPQLHRPASSAESEDTKMSPSQQFCLMKNRNKTQHITGCVLLLAVAGINPNLAVDCVWISATLEMRTVVRNKDNCWVIVQIFHSNCLLHNWQLYSHHSSLSLKT